MDNKHNAIISRIDVSRDGQGALKDWTVAIKDNFNLEGTLTTASSKMLENYKSVYTAHALDLLLDAGARITMKTSMDELGMGGSNRNAVTGPVLNPHDLSRITGGSSGGSAAVLANNDVRLALGTDTGDSVRRPAAFCGIVGVKPTYGRISRYGVVPFASSMDHVAYFTHNVSDAALALEKLAGRDDRDMTTSFKEVDAYSQLLDMDLKGKRIGILKTVHDTMDHSVIGDALSSVVSVLKDAGALLVEKEMDLNLLRAVLPTYSIISNAEALANHASLDGVRFGYHEDGPSLEDIMTQSRGKGFSTQVKKRFVYGAYAMDAENQEAVFIKAKKVRRKIVESYRNLFNDVDILIVMASGIIAPKVDDAEMSSTSDAALIGESHMALQNFSGNPSMTIPVGLHQDMPLGLNITSKAFDEKTMFAFAKELETLLGGKQ